MIVEAEFSGEPLTGAPHLTVSFTDESTGDPTGWTWLFGDEDFNAPWREMNGALWWSKRYLHSMVTLDDGTLVLMGGVDNGHNTLHDVWQSVSAGAVWRRLTDSAEWPIRSEYGLVVMPDGSIILLGGRDEVAAKNDIWKSTDGGISWELVIEHAPWSSRFLHKCIVTNDGDILITGGIDTHGSKNDVWKSTDSGVTWTQVTASAGWTARCAHVFLELLGGSIIVMGGFNASYEFKNDVWTSDDGGLNWTNINGDADWSERGAFEGVVTPSGDIIILGGWEGGYVFNNEVWVSADGGVTWSETVSSAPWSERGFASSAIMGNGDIVIAGGASEFTNRNDVWTSSDNGVNWKLTSSQAMIDPRYYHTSVALVDDTVLIMGGMDNNPDLPIKNDVWKSIDKGVTWTEVTSGAEWAGRVAASTVVTPSGDIITMGGNIGDLTYVNDVWKSSNGGLSWTRQTEHAGWSARDGHSAVCMSDGSIVLAGGEINDGTTQTFYNDVWISDDDGATWTQQTANAEWTARADHSCVKTPEGYIILVAGGGVENGNNDAWISIDYGESWELLTAETPEWQPRRLQMCIFSSEGYLLVSGGRGDDDVYLNDEWGSMDYGETWFLVAATTAWSPIGSPKGALLSDDSIVMTGIFNGSGVVEIWRTEKYWSTWILTTLGAGGVSRSGHVAFSFPDGDIVVMGGYSGATYYNNDVWLTEDNGVNWRSLTTSASWDARNWASGVILSDGSIVIMGGQEYDYTCLNDVWRSTDKGETWTRMTANAEWSPRFAHSSVVTSDDSIILTGGIVSIYHSEGGGYVEYVSYSEVWKSTDMGATWVEINSDADWGNRDGHATVLLPDGSILLSGGEVESLGSISKSKDLWRSTDEGLTWSVLKLESEWPERVGHSMVVLPDGSIFIVGGLSKSGYKNDIWRSLDNGSTWSLTNATNEWVGRWSFSLSVVPNGNLILIGGEDNHEVFSDIWSLELSGSSERNPDHVYDSPGKYNVALTAYNDSTSSVTSKTGYVTIISPGLSFNFRSSRSGIGTGDFAGGMESWTSEIPVAQIPRSSNTFELDSDGNLVPTKFPIGKGLFAMDSSNNITTTLQPENDIYFETDDEGNIETRE